MINGMSNSMSNGPIIIDVREPDEYSQGHVEGALNITASQLMAGSRQLNDVPKGAKIIVYCRSGGRSQAAIQILGQLGYTNLINGINASQVSKYL